MGGEVGRGSLAVALGGGASRGLAGGAAEPPPPPPPPPAGARSPDDVGAAADAALGPRWFVEVETAADFQALIESSLKRPLLLDCYADWCQPCRTLTPKLEQAAVAQGGAFRLAKLNVEGPGLQQVVQQLQVQSLPTVLLVFQGKIRDVKVGVPPEEELQAFLGEAAKLGENLGGGDSARPASEVLEDAFAALERASGPGGGKGSDALRDAAVLLSGLMERDDIVDADRARAWAGLARAALVEGEPEAAKSLLEQAEGVVKAESQVPEEVRAVAALIELSADTAGGGDLAELEAQLAQSPEDPEVALSLASAKFSAGDAEGAVELALGLVKTHRDWNDAAGRKLAVKIFDALGESHPVAVRGRRRLSLLWF